MDTGRLRDHSHRHVRHNRDDDVHVRHELDHHDIDIDIDNDIECIIKLFDFEHLDHHVELDLCHVIIDDLLFLLFKFNSIEFFYDDNNHDLVNPKFLNHLLHSVDHIDYLAHDQLI
jgi:hypothetical protein